MNSEIEKVFGVITPPPPIAALPQGAAGINSLLNTAIQLIYTVAAVIFVFMFLFAALQWIMSGGEKDKVQAAQGRITHAIIGIVLLALAFLIFRVLSKITGFEFFTGSLL